MSRAAGKIENVNKIPENQAAPQVPLASRWCDAEKNLLGNACCSPSPNPKPREDHIARLFDARDALAAYGWSSVRNQAIFQAAVRIVESRGYPGPQAIESELRRIGNVEAADFTAELSRDFSPMPNCNIGPGNPWN